MNHFRDEEFMCPCGCQGLPVRFFMETVDEVRRLAQIPFRINSGFRCKDHNKAVGGKDRSAHVQGVACDIACTTSSGRFKIVNSALSAGITRIGIYKTFIHLDISALNPQEVIWYG